MITIRFDSLPLGLVIGLQSEAACQRVQGSRSRQGFHCWLPGSDPSRKETALHRRSRLTLQLC
jgi:hypothetical protein